MTSNEILAELKSQGNEGYKKIMMIHGAKEPIFGVKIEYLKKIQKRVKMDYQLALDLYDSGVSDAMYLAGLIADDMRMTKKDLQKWVAKAYCSMHSEYTVPWVASASQHGWALANEWVESAKEHVAAAGWSTLASLVATKNDDELDIPALKKLLQRVQKSMHKAPNRVRYAMNGFVISVGSAVTDLHEPAIQTARKIGKVSVDMGGTACKVPDAEEYIDKVAQRGAIGKKRKSAKC
jgi:3-methyladenine DNA glycosylase AlkD